MGIALILLFQLWTQPSVRILGLGSYYADFVPDSISDITRNPAYLKIMSDNAKSYLPQVYSMLRSYNPATLTELMPNKEFYENEELISFHILDPKIGLACRYGFWQRMDGGPYVAKEWLWSYGQAGFAGAINILKLINIGGEYNFSWNDRPDNFVLNAWDSLGNDQPAYINESVWSNEIGFGIVLADKNLWELSISGKKNSEEESFTSNIPYYFERGPEGLLTAFEANFYDVRFNTRLRFTPNEFTHTANFSCFRKKVVRDGVNSSLDYYLTAFRPGIGTVFYPRENILTIASIFYEVENIDYNAFPGTFTIGRKVIGLTGFEAQMSRTIKFRFGNALIYDSYYESKKIKNEVSFGIDIIPYEKLILNIATQNPLDYAFWFFGVSFKL